MDGHAQFRSQGRTPRHTNGAYQPAAVSPRRSTITRDNVRVSDIRRVDMILHLNDQSSIVVRDVAFSALGK